MECIREERVGAAAILTLARPDRRNALSEAMMRELAGALRAAGCAPGVRAVILAAEGPVFCSGHDLKELQAAGEEDHRRIFAVCTELMETIHALPRPVIAEVQGLATAAGCQLVAACDLAVAGEEAGFATPGVKIGLFCTTPMVEVARAVGPKRAFEMLVTGRVVGAREAAEWGLVNRVAPAAELRATALELAELISQAPEAVIASGKQSFQAQAGLPRSEAYGLAQRVMARDAGSAEAREGIAAFLEKRAPRWPV
jgi:enoyl-CoA hydratase/carnithine racemase